MKSIFQSPDWTNINALVAETSKRRRFLKKRNLSIDSHCSDKLVSVLSLGFWVDMFSSHSFLSGNQTLLKIFPNKEKGIGRRIVHKELDKIRIFRNRIAHHEAICFDKKGRICAKYRIMVENLILKYIKFLGLPDEFLQNVNYSALC